MTPAKIAILIAIASQTVSIVRIGDTVEGAGIVGALITMGCLAVISFFLVID